MERTFDDDLINSYIANDPVFFSIKNAKDFPNVYFLLDDGCLFFCLLDGDLMRCHACVKKGSRGKKAVDAGRKLIKWVFKNTNARKVVTKADKLKRHLLIYNALLLNRCGEDEKFVYYEVSR